MKYLKVQNVGELDVRLISLMGGTTKTGNSYKIGRFGSGLKYSLAWLVRNNIDFKIFIGEKEVKISTQPETIQGTTFDVIYIDGQRSSIAASTGADWKGWMVCREIFCNAVDEGTYLKEITELLVGEEGSTTFYLQIIGEIKETVDNWEHYFMTQEMPLYQTKDFAIYPASKHFAIYKQGILIHENERTKGVFSYDIKNATINELREYKGMLTYDIVQIISQLDKRNIELFIGKMNKDHYEHDMDYDWTHQFTGAWKEALGSAKIIAKDDYDSLKARGVSINEAGMVIVPPTLFKKLSETFEGISAVRRADKVSAFWETFDSELELKIKSALAMLEVCNYEINPELKFIYGVFGDKTCFAKVNIDEKVVMFSEELKRKTMFEIVCCVVEENEHARTSFDDCSRPFQQHFINLYTKELLDRNEIKV